MIIKIFNFQFSIFPSTLLKMVSEVEPQSIFNDQIPMTNDQSNPNNKNPKKTILDIRAYDLIGHWDLVIGNYIKGFGHWSLY